MKTLLKEYTDYAKTEDYPFHMPGHKRNAQLVKMENPYAFDTTEIDPLDDLHEACAFPDSSSMIAQSMKRASALFHSRQSFYTVNGSTGGLIASILAMTKPHQTVLVPRNCHVSVFHAIALSQLNPVWLYPSIDEDTSIYSSIDPQDVVKAFEQHPEITLVIVTSPTYNGVVSDIRSIAGITHAHHALLLVDEAHGPHLSLCDAFPESAVTAGADVVVQSLHKTLPALTQTAIVHICSDRIDPSLIQRAICIEETSSPSYVLVSSCDQCITLMEQHGSELFEAYLKRLDHFSESMKALQHLHVLCKGNDSIGNHPTFFAFDQGKIFISTKGTSIHGEQLYQLLWKKYHLILESRLADYAIAMSSVADTDEGFKRLTQALLEIDSTLSDVEEKEPFPFHHNLLQVPAMSPCEALAQDCEKVPVENAEGRIMHESVYAYPPGIPILAPGEVIDATALSQIHRMKAAGIGLKSSSHCLPYIEVLKTDMHGCS